MRHRQVFVIVVGMSRSYVVFTHARILMSISMHVRNLVLTGLMIIPGIQIKDLVLKGARRRKVWGSWEEKGWGFLRNLGLVLETLRPKFHPPACCQTQAQLPVIEKFPVQILNGNFRPTSFHKLN